MPLLGFQGRRGLCRHGNVIVNRLVLCEDGKDLQDFYVTFKGKSDIDGVMH